MTTTEERAAVIERLRVFPAQLEALVAPLSDTDLDKRIPGEWSVRQIVHHVADSHMNAVGRFKKPLTEDTPALPDYDQDAYALLPDYALPVDVSLAILHALHARFVALLLGLDADQWAREGLHPRWGAVSVTALARKYADHGDNHIDQIQRTLAYQG